VGFYTPGGTLIDKWRPIVAGNDWAFQEMMAPLTPYKTKINVIEGLNLSIAFDDDEGVGHTRCRGMAACFTGHSLFENFADGPSIDQVIAPELSKQYGQTPFSSVEVATAWGTGMGANRPHSSNILNMAGAGLPIPPGTDPLAVFIRIFGADQLSETSDQKAAAVAALDEIAHQYDRVIKEVAPDDRSRLQEHLNRLHEVRQSAALVTTSCQLPTVSDKADAYTLFDADPSLLVDAGDTRSNTNVKLPTNVETTGLVMSDLLVAALACNMTHVGTMQWSDSEAKFLLTFLNDSNGVAFQDHHWGYQGDRKYDAPRLSIIYNWYAKKLAYLLEKMESIKVDGDKTLLDHSAVLTLTETGNPRLSERMNVPTMVIGGAGGKLQTGRYLKVESSQPHSHLLLSLCQLYGYSGSVIGNPKYCKGPLAGFV
jgi:hypothetical protein